MTVLTQPNTLGDGIKFEEDNFYSREKITVLSGQDLALLEVIAKVLFSVPTTGTAGGSNTGDGTCTGVTGDLKNTIEETFTLTCTAAAADGGTFSVVGSKTGRLADAEVGVAYDSDFINFTLNDGATDFVVGDTFTIEISEGSDKVVALDPDAVDGSQFAAGIMCLAVDASAADKEGVAIVRHAQFVSDNLVWPDGITADEKALAIEQLAALGIIESELA